LGVDNLGFPFQLLGGKILGVTLFRTHFILTRKYLIVCFIFKGNYVLYELSGDQFPHLVNVDYLLCNFTHDNDGNIDSDYLNENNSEDSKELSLFGQTFVYELIENSFLLDFKKNEFFLKNLSLFSYQPMSSTQTTLFKLENEMGSRMNLKKRNLGIDFSLASTSKNNNIANARVVKMFQSRTLVLVVVEVCVLTVIFKIV
jgi:hypothetical protein